ncbi:MAG: transposase [Chloroflexota bacterium]
MVPEQSLLVTLVLLIDHIPVPPTGRHRGHPQVYSSRLFLKALVIMIVRHLPRVHSLLAVLDEPTPDMRRLRALLSEDGRFPCRRTWERRLGAIPDTLPAQIACLGQHLLALLDPWQGYGRAVAIDSTPLRALGGLWHQKHRRAGVVPHTSIDTEANWARSGWHGWFYGWKLHLVSTVASVWLPLAAELTAANTADNVQAFSLLADLPAGIRFVLGDTAYDDAQLGAYCWTRGATLLASRRGPHPHPDEGAAVRRIFHLLRSRAIENFNGQFKAIFGCLGQVPTRGLVATRRYVLGAVLVYQLVLLYRFQAQQDLRVGLKPLVQAA